MLHIVQLLLEPGYTSVMMYFTGQLKRKQKREGEGTIRKSRQYMELVDKIVSIIIRFPTTNHKLSLRR